MSHSDRIDELEKKFSENPRRYFAPLANEYRKAGDLNRAIEICRSHLPQQPGHMSGHIVYGQALYESRQLAEAKGVFEAALGLDPENLIALRHLGDIARDSGDPQTARLWYLRVLDADPRNDEVAGMLAELDAAVAAAPPPPSGSVGWGDINPERAAAGGGTATAPEPADLATAPADGASDLALERASPDNDAFLASLGATGGAGTPAAGTADQDPLAQDPTWDSGAEAPPRAAAPTPVVGMRAVAPPPPATGSGKKASDLDEQTFAEVDALFDEISTPERPAPAAPTRDAPKPPAGEIVRERADAEGESIVAPEISGLETREFVAPPREAPAARVAPGALPGLTSFGAEDQQDAGTPAAFVTETMAELYLQQGFAAEALEIYRKLLAQNPNDRGLRDRVAQLESGGQSSLSAAAVSSEVIEAARQRQAVRPVRTVRSFFGSLAGRRAPQQGETVHDFAAETEEFTVVQPPTRRETPPPAPRDGAPARGPLGALFGSGSVSVEDEEAAAALAAAFGPSPGEPTPAKDGVAGPGTGRPARTGSQELSLDEIFRESGNRVNAQKSGSYSFDQFFSPGSSPSTPSASNAGAQGGDDGPPEGDLEQFTAWLEGLKRK